MTKPSASTKLMANLIAVLSLIGAAMNAFLTSHFYGLRSGSASFQSYCNLNAKFNCDAVATSSYAELLPGFPLSSFGAGWFLAAFLFSFLLKQDDAKKRAEMSRFFFVFASFGLLFDVHYFIVMAFVLKTFCLLCLLVEATGVLTFVLAWMHWRENKHSATDSFFASAKNPALALFACLFIGIFGLKGLDSVELSRADMETQVNSIFSDAPVVIAEDPSAPSLGPVNARVTIVEYSDFQCPFCRMGALSLHPVQARYPNDVRVVFRHYPLDSACNRQVTRTMHPVACEAARLAACAHQDGKFKEVYETLFEHQELMAKQSPYEILKAKGPAGLDADKLNACAASDATKLRVSQDIEAGIALKVESTPTFFVNGYKINGALPPAAWNLLVERILKR